MNLNLISALSVLIVGTVLVTAALTPLVYSALSTVFSQFPYPFSRVFDRVAMVVMPCGIYFMRRHFQFGSISSIFSRPTGKTLKVWDISLGLVVTLGTSTVVLALLVANEVLVWRPLPLSEQVLRVAKSVPAALFISLIEEVFFRVLLLSAMLRLLRPFYAVVVTSGLYAIVHFISPVRAFLYTEFKPWAGFEYLYVVFERFLFPGVPRAALGLFLVGVILCDIMIRFRSVYLCIGMHAGWVSAVKIGSYFTRGHPLLHVPEGIGARYLFVSQPITWLSFLIIWGVIRLIYRSRAQIKTLETPP